MDLETLADLLTPQATSPLLIDQNCDPLAGLIIEEIHLEYGMPGTAYRHYPAPLVGCIVLMLLALRQK